MKILNKNNKKESITSKFVTMKRQLENYEVLLKDLLLKKMLIQNDKDDKVYYKEQAENIKQKAGEIKESLKTIANDFLKILKSEKIKPNELHFQIDVETALYECKSWLKSIDNFETPAKLPSYLKKHALGKENLLHLSRDSYAEVADVASSGSGFLLTGIDPNLCSMEYKLLTLLENSNSTDNETIDQLRKKCLRDATNESVDLYTLVFTKSCLSELCSYAYLCPLANNESDKYLLTRDCLDTIKSYYKHYTDEINKYKEIVKERGVDFPADRVVTKEDFEHLYMDIDGMPNLKGLHMLYEKLDQLDKLDKFDLEVKNSSDAAKNIEKDLDKHFEADNFKKNNIDKDLNQ